MKNVLIDTNILIGHLNGDEKATALLLKLDGIRISVMSEYELLAGLTEVCKEQRMAALDMLSAAIIYPVTSPIVRRAADYTVKYGRKKGVDHLIAATLREHCLDALVTLNTADFPMIKTIKP